MRATDPAQIPTCEGGCAASRWLDCVAALVDQRDVAEKLVTEARWLIEYGNPSWSGYAEEWHTKKRAWLARFEEAS